MGILRSHTTHHLSSHFHSKDSLTPKESSQSAPTSEPTLGLNRSNTDPLTLSNLNITSNPSQTPPTSTSTTTTPPPSRPISGTSSPSRQKSSLDIVRNLRDRPLPNAIPGYYHVAEQLHKYKMRNCHGMSATEEETQGIDRMKKWSWKHAGRPGEEKYPVGPMGEEFVLEGVALEQVGRLRRVNSS